MAHMLSLENNLWDSVLTFCHVGFKDQTQIGRPDVKLKCPWTFLWGLKSVFKWEKFSPKLIIHEAMEQVKEVRTEGLIYDQLVDIIG